MDNRYPMKFAAVLAVLLLLSVFGVGSMLNAPLSMLIIGALVIVAACVTFGRSLEVSARSARSRQRDYISGR